MLDQYIKLYESKTPKSRSLFDQSTKRFPGGVSHNIRYFEPYPFFTQKAHGKHLWDVDNNKYTDYWMGHWSLILGHSPEVVVDALKTKVPDGTIFGTANELSVRLAEFINKLMPSAEMVRFSSTGTEATMYAARLARAFTGKRVIAKIEGGWHGFNSTLLKSVNFPFEEEEGTGLLEEEQKYIVSLPFNNLEASIKILDSIKNDLSCIIVEPLLGGAGCIPAEKEYLHGLQEYAKRSGALFVLDEIVTGFRLSLKGAQDIFSVEPDLFTLGKIVGGGMPIGVLCGRKEIMQLSDPKREKGQRCSIGGGTFSANPLSMAAGLATLVHLVGREAGIYDRINKLGEEARRSIDKVMNENNVKVKTTGMGSLFLTHFLTDKVRDVKSARDAASCNVELQKAYHFALMAKYGIFFLPHKLGAISVEHDSDDIKQLIDASEHVGRSLFSMV
ncbi:MAG: aspartate aminotransferase family protein [Nitrososphaerales archaeon]